MNSYYWLICVALLVLILAIALQQRRKNAAIVNHRRNHKNKEMSQMKELAEKFIGKECLIYTIASDTNSANGTVKEVTDNGILIEYKGELQAVNLEYVTKIKEWPKNSKGKKKSVVF